MASLLTGVAVSPMAATGETCCCRKMVISLHVTSPPRLKLRKKQKAVTILRVVLPTRPMRSARIAVVLMLVRMLILLSLLPPLLQAWKKPRFRPHASLATREEQEQLLGGSIAPFN